MKKKSIEDIEFKYKRVFMRVDFNVPLDDTGNIRDDTRMGSADLWISAWSIPAAG